MAQQHGAQVLPGARVLGWSASACGSSVTVDTDAGSFSAASLVLAAGAWMGQLVPELKVTAARLMCLTLITKHAQTGLLLRRW